MRRSYVWVVLLCLAGVQARADEASKRAKVEELFTVMRLSQMTEQITRAVRQQVENTFHSMPGMEQMTPAQKQLLTDYENRSMAMVDGSMGWKALEPDMANLYVSTYSEQEIDGILGFYKSPVGQSMLAKTPELTTKSLQITQGRMVALQPRMTEMMQEFMRQFAAAGTGGAKPKP